MGPTSRPPRPAPRWTGYWRTNHEQGPDPNHHRRDRHRRLLRHRRRRAAGLRQRAGTGDRQARWPHRRLHRGDAEPDHHEVFPAFGRRLTKRRTRLFRGAAGPAGHSQTTGANLGELLRTQSKTDWGISYLLCRKINAMGLSKSAVLPDISSDRVALVEPNDSVS